MSNADKTRVDAGLLLLRIGVGANFLLLFLLKQAEASAVFALHPSRTWPLLALASGAVLVTVGFLTRVAAAAMTLSWTWALATGLYLGQPFYLFPVRAVLFIIIFATLAFTGAGRFSVDRRVELRR
jgi:uncharacterized membrane protein YphA (DoxX/SURF4 family)